jgi:c-di-GMP-binding flagellar brake protein YcgR
VSRPDAGGRGRPLVFLPVTAVAPRLDGMSLDRRRTERERRQARRVAAVFAVKETTGHQVQLGQAEDIAPCGMTLRWPKDAALVPESPVVLTFELPGTDAPIAARATVVNTRRTGRYRRTGVRFEALEPDAAQRIAQYCARRA